MYQRTDKPDVGTYRCNKEQNKTSKKVEGLKKNYVKEKAVFRIHDILEWIRIRIRGSMPLTNGSGSGTWIRILLLSSLTFKMPTKNNFCLNIFSAYYCLKVHLHNFPKIKVKKSHKIVGIKVFLLFLHDDRRIRIQSHTSDKWIRIREAQKHVDPVDPGSDPDPGHCEKEIKWDQRTEKGQRQTLCKFLFLGNNGTSKLFIRKFTCGSLVLVT
jgi:hypothetical protein